MITRLRVLLLVLLAAGQVSVRAADETDRFAALIGLARVKRDAGDAGAARRYFEEARRVRPLLPAELAEYFWVVAGLDPAGALNAGRDVLAATPRNADVRDRMIGSAVALHDEAAVIALATAGRQIDPSNARWSRRLGDSYLRQGRFADAVDAFSAAVAATAETDVRDRAGLAVALEASGRHARAVAAWVTVPLPIQNERPEWTASRLRALAYAAPSSDAATEITAWLVRHPNDDVMRIALVDLWTRAGQPARALEALTPLLSGAVSDRWLPREAELARAAGTPQVAIARLAARAARPDAPTSDRWALADLLVDAHEYTRAESVASAASPIALGCDDRLLRLIDRVPGAAGTDALLNTLDVRSCDDRPQWLARGIERAVADTRHARALRLLHRLPEADASTPSMRRLEGQLLLWTGHAADAAATLDAVLSAHPDDIVARQALVDAYRTAGAPVAAWTAAQPLLRELALPVDQRLNLATLALDARRPDEAMAIVEAIQASGSATLRAELTGRARLMQGRVADAWRSLSAVNADALTPDGALALIDSVSATRGLSAAIETSRHFRETSPPWRDVLARRVVIETIGGDRETSTRLRASLAALDPSTAVVTDVEVALAQERPHDALALLDRLQATTPSSSRTNDLRATALEGVGDYAGAATLLSALLLEQPTTASFAIRYAVVEWRRRPQADTMQRVLDLPSRWPGNQDAAIAAATALASGDRFEDALGRLGDPASWTHLPSSGRLLVARSLRGLGRSTEALGVVDDLPTLTAGGALLRAQLIATVRGAGAATSAFRTAAAEPDAAPDVYLSWGAVASSEADRLDVLNAGARRFPGNVPLLTALASAEWAERHLTAATAAAERAVAADAHAGGAWFVLVDAAADASSTTALDSALSRFDAMTPDDVSLRIGMAEHVMGIGRNAETGVMARALTWLDAVPANHPLAGARDLARVRVLAASRHWTDALRDIDDVIARDHHAPAPLKLRAEVLSWSGRHEDAIHAYDDYLAAAPLDVEARRQQARVATWAGRADQARALYASLEASAPDHAAIAAEAKAKNAFLAGHWEAAAAAYRAWLALEPGDTEARFELAESLRAMDHVDEADAELDRLVRTSGHQLAFAARSRERTLRAPSFSIVDDQKNANGYSGQRLLDSRQRGGGVSATFGARGATRVGADGARLDAGSGDAHRHGYRTAFSVAQSVSPSLRLEGEAAAWTLTDRGLALWSGRATWRPTDVWTLQGGVQREAVVESLSTIDARLTGSGPFADAGYDTSSSSLDLRGSWQSLSDGNSRRRASLTYTRVVDERLRQVRAIVWAEELAYRDRAPLYFSPSGFLRADAGVEYTHAFSPPRFRGDRHNEFAAGYLLGTDSHGTLYQHPTIRLNLELTNGLAFDARGSLIRSATYNESAFTIGFRIVGIGSEKR